ncbi:MAG: ABC transporter ATP-binding protein [Pseudobdellovibrionaceae bacterium]
MNEPLIRAVNIRNSYSQGASELEILKGISLDIKKGDAICIVGASGAGKSTFMHILGTLDQPSQGELYFQNQSLLSMADEELALFRNKEMGFVFQFHHLLSEFTALENVMIPARVAGLDKSEALDRAEVLLRQMGLTTRMTHFPSQLSGGELQRVAIARALVCKPQVLFADEPTGNLDSQNGALIQDLFFQLKETMGLTLVVVTHDPNFSRKFGKVHRISDGRWV